MAAGIFTLVFYLASGVNAALSAALGALIFVVPQQIFVLKAFRYMGARSAYKTVQGFYSGESTKLILVAIGFALVFSFYQEANVFALMTSFIGLVVINGLIPLIVTK